MSKLSSIEELFAGRQLDDIRPKLYEPAIDSVSGMGPVLPDLSAI